MLQIAPRTGTATIGTMRIHIIDAILAVAGRVRIAGERCHFRPAGR